MILAIAVTICPAYAGPQCIPIEKPKAAIESKGGRWVSLTKDQYRFAQGIFVMDPSTPPRLPYGDTAALATIVGKPGGIVFWIDGGDLACEPMPLPQIAVDMILDIGSDIISHEGARL